MLSQPVNLASFISRDAGKRKRLNRSAKLKQCKLDARREQWLSQVKSSSCNYQHARVEIAESKEGKIEDATLTVFKTLRVSAEVRDHAASDDESLIDDGPGLEEETPSEKSSNQGTESEYSGGDGFICEADSKDITTIPDKDDDLSVEDDWEAAADALILTVTSTSKDSTEKAQPVKLETEQSQPQNEILQQHFIAAPIPKTRNDVRKPEYQVSYVGNRTTSTESRAWRTNDVFAKLWKPHASHLQSCVSVWAAVQRKSRWEQPTAPLECPICTEELDSTDYSFKPCSCDFRLCLFCHHKIAAEDGRCPGCRKAYSTDISAKLTHSAAATHC